MSTNHTTIPAYNSSRKHHIHNNRTNRRQKQEPEYEDQGPMIWRIRNWWNERRGWRTSQRLSPSEHAFGWVEKQKKTMER